jgi:hypothetical protein
VEKHSDKRPSVDRLTDLLKACEDARDISGYEKVLEKYNFPEDVKKQLLDRLKRVVADEMREKWRL